MSVLYLNNKAAGKWTDVIVQSGENGLKICLFVLILIDFVIFEKSLPV